MADKKFVYMIRRKSDGLYSAGGTTPIFTKNGKTWSSIGALKNHLNQAIIRDYGYKPWKNDNNKKSVYIYRDFETYADCEIVAFEIVTTESPDTVPFTIDGYFTDRLIVEAQDMLRTDNNIEIIFPDGSKETIFR